mmetsp:Transcript_55185/g.161057  ORF Transcript_55185/g.161057 Transcript_55185/m.161057 type:complete len:84 (+) Transcript_55185:305-556(+)
MFHGCRSAGNEDSIVASGFHAYPSWFAYSSTYSDGGYAFCDSHGWKHLFVCLVSRSQVRHDDTTVRVVGQGGAYPHWIVHYRQ